MHRLALAPLLFMTGCLLYTGSLNHPPQVTVTPTAMSTNLGAPVTFHVVASDIDEPAGNLHTTPSVDAADGQAAPTRCDVTVISFGNDFSVTFSRPGIYRVTVTVTDSERAQGSAVTMLTVTNAPPQLDPTAATVTTPALPNGCGVYTAGQGVPVLLNGMATDADLPGPTFAECAAPEVLTYQWRVVPPPGSVAAKLTLFDNGKCTPATSSDGPTLTTTSPAQQVCVWPDYGKPLVPSPYFVEVDASDGSGESQSVGVSVDVEADQPPCITSVEPVAGSYVVDPNDPRGFARLAVSQVADDLDAFPQITFVWSLWRETDPSWRTIDTHDYSYSPDYSLFGVGEHVRIRVEAVDRTGTLGSCDVAQDTCVASSCAAPNCAKWTTWDLELR